MSHTNEKSRIGVDGARTDAHIINTSYHRSQPTDCRSRLVHKVLSDHSTEAAHRLRYYLQNIDGAILSAFVHWPVDLATAELMDVQGVIQPRALLWLHRQRFRATSLNGDYYIRHRVSINNSVASIVRILGVVSRISVPGSTGVRSILRTPIESDLDGCRIS